MDEVFVAKNEDDFATAVSRLEEIVRDHPRYPAAIGLLGHILFSVYKDAKRSLPLFRRVVKLSPKSERASLGLFHSLWKLGRKRDALKELLRFQSISSCGDYVGILEEIREKDPELLPVNQRT